MHGNFAEDFLWYNLHNVIKCKTFKTKKIVRTKSAIEDITSNRNKIKSIAIKFDIQHYLRLNFKTKYFIKQI